jgi:nuclear pore complex protein Nup93
MIEENFARVQRDFDAYLEESMSLNWDEQRRKVYEHFGLAQKLDDQDESLNFANTTKGTFGRSTRKGRSQGPGSASVGSAAGRSVLGRSGMEKSVIGTPGMGSGNAALFSDTAERNGILKASDDRFVREREENFAKEVGNLNEARSKKVGFPILHDFAEVETRSGGEVSILGSY